MGIVHTVLVWAWVNCAGNIVASGITTTLGLWWHHRRISAKHADELRKLRIHLLGAISEQRQAGDR